MEKLEFGTVYLDELPKNMCSYEEGRTLSLGDSYPFQEISWIPCGEFLAADRVVCVNVSWQDLEKNHLVDGSVAKIDGKYYLCRLLQVNDQVNEWKQVLAVAGNSDRAIHWERTYFWINKPKESDGPARFALGFSSPHEVRTIQDNKRYTYVGFRPALEPLGDKIDDPASLVGHKVKLWGPKWVSVKGTLFGVDDYDLGIIPDEPIPADLGWAVWQSDESVTIDRASVAWLKEA